MLKEEICLNCRLQFCENPSEDFETFHKKLWKVNLVYCHKSGGPIETKEKIPNNCSYYLEQILLGNF